MVKVVRVVDKSFHLTLGFILLLTLSPLRPNEIRIVVETGRTLNVRMYRSYYLHLLG